MEKLIQTGIIAIVVMFVTTTVADAYVKGK